MTAIGYNLEKGGGGPRVSGVLGTFPSSGDSWDAPTPLNEWGSEKDLLLGAFWGILNGMRYGGQRPETLRTKPSVFQHAPQATETVLGDLVQ